MTIMIASLILLSAILLLNKQVLLAIGRFLVIQDNLQAADIIHVIAGPDYRTDHAIKLYKQGYGKKIFFTGGWCQLQSYFHGQHAKERALEKKISVEAIAIDDSQVTSTFSEVVKLKEFLDKSQVPINSVIVVSDPYHMRRARWTYRRVLGGKISIEMAPVPFEMTPYKCKWWTDKESRHYVYNEYLKIAYYYARYKFSWGPVKDWLVSFDQD